MKSYINSIEFYVPKTELSNLELSNRYPEWSVEKISQKTGINARYIVSENISSSDLAFEACVNLFQKNDIDLSSIDFLILCTQSPDYLLPTTACILQNRLGLSKSIGAFDFNLGCSGYVYGLGIAEGLIKSKQANNILLVTAETYSKYINERDKSCMTIFGDAASATLIANYKSKNDYGYLGNFMYGTDGSGYDKFIISNKLSSFINFENKSIDVIDDDGNFIRNNDNIWMDGKGIFEFTMDEIPRLLNNFLIKNNINIENVDLFVFHQANKYMLEMMRRKMNIPSDKFVICIENYGNTVSNTIPIALKEISNSELYKKSNNIILCGFGVGLSMSICNILKK
jgi:3-oxoacyl-[acyl-carrier-protein] synthase-3